MPALFNDDFNRANAGTLGANWTDVFAGWNVTGNQAAPAATTSLAYWNGGTPPAACYVQGTYVTNVASPGFLDLVWRYDVALSNLYAFVADTTGAAVIRYDGFVPTGVGATFTKPSNGDVVRVTHSGSTISVYYNNTLQVTRTDATYSAAGRAGLGGADTAGRIDNFEAGSLPYVNLKTSEESVTTTDIFSRKRLKTRDDAATTADGNVNWKRRARMTTDSLVTPDELLRMFRRTRITGDDIVLIDSFSKNIIGSGTIYTLVKSDAIYIFNEPVRQFAYRLTATDAIDALDDNGRLQLIAIISTDELALTDAAAIGARFKITKTDNVTVYDPGNRIVTHRLTTADLLTVIDAFVKTLVPGSPGGTLYTRVSTENLVISDELLRMFRLVAVRGDTATAIDSLTRFVSRSRMATDNLTAIDQIVVMLLKLRSITDAIIVGDGTTLMRRIVKVIDDTLTLIDSFTKLVQNAGLINFRIVTEGLTITDAALRMLQITRITTDGCLATDGFQTYRERVRSMAEGVTLTDAFFDGLRRMRQTTDAVEMADGVIKVRWSRKFLTDLLGISDEALPTYLPWVEYLYDVRITLGFDSPILLGIDEPIHLGADFPVQLGGYN